MSLYFTDIEKRPSIEGGSLFSPFLGVLGVLGVVLIIALLDCERQPIQTLMYNNKRL